MRLNTLQPAVGAKTSKKRLGRGIGSGLGKTSGHGHKGQKARKGYNKKIGFEGGQMPLKRRVPKFGFTSMQAADVAEVRLSTIDKIPEARVGIEELKKHDVIKSNIRRIKVIVSGNVTRPVVLYGAGIKVTAGARSAIEKSGGKIEE
jgi:large subunit ribosomal protein L15